MPNKTGKRDYPWYIVAQIERPYSFEWWIGLSARAFYRWTHGELDTERWTRLDRYLQERAQRALQGVGVCVRCGDTSPYTSMVRWQERLYCPPCLMAIYPRKSVKRSAEHE